MTPETNQLKKMKAKDLKAAVASGKLDRYTVSRINKTPLTRRQSDSLYVVIEGIGKVDTTEIIRATKFKPYEHKMTLHFCGLSCPLDGQMVWDAFYDIAAEADRRDSWTGREAGDGVK